MISLRLITTRKRDVYYFLGNIHQHIIHALPLYRVLGGTFIVTSRDSYEFCVSRGVKVVMLDDRPDLYLQYDASEIRQTIDYINKNARIVLFYEVFTAMQAMTGPCKIMLNHGNSFKDYFIEWRQEPTLAFDYYVTLGPVWEQKVLRIGYPEDKMVRVGLARWDEIIKSAGRVSRRKKVNKMLDLDPSKPLIAYMPTWWGATSVYDIGWDILRYIPDDYQVIFRPHPDTPIELINKIKYLIKLRENIYYLPENESRGLELTSIYAASELFIGDMSSVTLDAMLTKKPMIFAFGKGKRAQDKSVYEPVREIFENSAHLNAENVEELGRMIKESLEKQTDQRAWQTSLERVFYGLKADNISKLSKFIRNPQA